MTGKMTSRRTRVHKRARPGAPQLKAVEAFRVSKHAKAKQPKPEKPK